MTDFFKEKQYLKKSKARHIIHQTTASERMKHAIHEFRWTLWAIVHGFFKLVGLEYLGEDVILRISLFIAIGPFVILSMLLINENREMRKR